MCRFQRKFKTKILFWISLYLIIILKLLYSMQVKEIRLKMMCYNSTEQSILLSIEELRPKENSIFFLETSCKGGLSPRQACAVESAATAHPNRQIYVLFSAPVKNKIMLCKVDEFYNVNVARIYMNFTKETISEDVFEKMYYLSTFPIVHAADVLRFATLYKWSGIYLDLDTVVVRTLDQLGNNWAAKEHMYNVSTGAMAFSNDEIGRTLIKSIVQEINQSFNPTLWSHNSNGIMVKVLKQYCNVKSTEFITTSHCKGFQIYDPDVVYPIHYLNASTYFEKGELLPDETKNTYIYHMWNALTVNLPVQDGSPYSQLAKKYCPNTYYLYQNEFGKLIF